MKQTMRFDELRRTNFHSTGHASEQIAWMNKVFQIALNYLFETPRKKIHSDLTLKDLEKIFFETDMPNQPLGIDAALEETVQNVLQHSVRLNNPKFVGHMTGATTVFSTAVEMLTAVLNQNLNKIETALSASFVERQTIAWVHRLCYDREDKFYKRLLHAPGKLLGTVTSGGTVGNLTALTVARNLALPGVDQKGLAPVLLNLKKQRAVIVTSRRAHYSVRKVASLLGLGSDNVIEIPVENFSNKVDLKILKARLAGLLREKVVVVAVVGVAGTTETGAIDDLAALADICAKNKIWFHVDAAWGGALLLSPTHRKKLAGIERAQSVVIDAHKFFYLPLDHGMVVFQGENALDAIRHHANYIIRSGSVDLGQTSLEGSRRFNSLKLWFALKALGRQGYAALIDHSMELAKRARAVLEAHAEFEVTSDVETNILTYRFVPAPWKQALLNHRKAYVDLRVVKKLTQKAVGKNKKSFAFANAILNSVNTDLQKIERQEGKSFVSRTTLESVAPGFDLVVLRMIPFNPFTTLETIQEILMEQAELGRKLLAAELTKNASKAPKDLYANFPHL